MKNMIFICLSLSFYIVLGQRYHCAETDEPGYHGDDSVASFNFENIINLNFEAGSLKKSDRCLLRHKKDIYGLDLLNDKDKLCDTLVLSENPSYLIQNKILYLLEEKVILKL